MRVLICDDSRMFARGLRAFLERDPEVEVVGVCGSAEELLACLPHTRADLITMDLELPGMDGIAATQQIVRTHSLPVVILSAHTGRSSARAAAALAAGAADAVPKSEVRLSDPDSLQALVLRRHLKLLAATPLNLRPMPAPQVQADGGVAPGVRAAAIGVCASTGGPAALSVVLSALPADFPIPILIVQHISAGFAAGLVAWMGEVAALPVRLGRDGDALTAGATFAPDGAHLLVDGAGHLRLDVKTVDGWHRPSGDMLLRSLAHTYGSRAVAVVLTGMGRDGADGLAAVKSAGGTTIAQDQATSVVWGMPQAAADCGARHVLPLHAVAAALTRLQRPERGR
jgi:two-component system chemotaxis response regulator CheB